jgi:Tfp pilus assembly protein PilN
VPEQLKLEGRTGDAGTVERWRRPLRESHGFHHASHAGRHGQGCGFTH